MCIRDRIRTLSLQNSVTFGTKEEADESAIRINKLHEVIKGEDEITGKIYDSLEITKDDGNKLILEVQSHIGENAVRTISMDSTDGVSRGTDVLSTGNPIHMPIGKNVYGRLFNVVGDAIDGLEVLPKTENDGMSIHREAPAFDQLSTSTEVLFTGIKVIDLIEPYEKG